MPEDLRSIDQKLLKLLYDPDAKWQKINWMQTEMAIFCYVQKKIQSQNNFSQIFFKFNFLNAMQKVKINWIALHFLRSSYQKVVLCRWVPWQNTIKNDSIWISIFTEKIPPARWCDETCHMKWYEIWYENMKNDMKNEISYEK